MIEIQDNDIEMDMINKMIYNMNKMEDGDMEIDTNDNTIENTKSVTRVITNNTVFSLDKEDSFLPDPKLIQYTPARQTSSQSITCDIQITNVMPAKTLHSNPLVSNLEKR